MTMKETHGRILALGSLIAAGLLVAVLPALCFYNEVALDKAAFCQEWAKIVVSGGLLVLVFRMLFAWAGRDTERRRRAFSIVSAKEQLRLARHALEFVAESSGRACTMEDRRQAAHLALAHLEGARALLPRVLNENTQDIGSLQLHMSLMAPCSARITSIMGTLAAQLHESDECQISLAMSEDTKVVVCALGNSTEALDKLAAEVDKRTSYCRGDGV